MSVAIVVLILVVLAIACLMRAIRIMRMSPEERAALRSKYETVKADSLRSGVSYSSDYDDEDPDYEHRYVEPTPWSDRVIFEDDDGDKYFVVWSGIGPCTEFSINRKSRIKGYPTRIMKGFDARMYITMKLIDSDQEETYCYDHISSQIKSVGHAGGKLLTWARVALGFDSSVLDAIPFDRSDINLDLLWSAPANFGDISFTCSSDGERNRITVTPTHLYRHKISDSLLVSVLDNGESRLIHPRQILTHISSDNHKKMPFDKWVEFVLDKARSEDVHPQTA